MKRLILCMIVFPFIVIAQQGTYESQLHKQYEYAEQLFRQEQFYDAATEYQRLLYFDTLHIYAYSANRQIGECYRNGAQFGNAIQYIGAALRYAKTPEDILLLKIELVKLHILNRGFSSAFNILEEIDKDSRFATQKQATDYWRGWIYIFQDEWDLAADAFAKVDSAASLKEFCLVTSEKKYSVPFVKIASAIIPGSGQMMTGHIWSGLLSLGWNGLWGYLTVHAAVSERVGDALLIGDLLWLRFYTGNLENAEKFANEKNTQLFQDALRYLQDEFKGAKP